MHNYLLIYLCCGSHSASIDFDSTSRSRAIGTEGIAAHLHFPAMTEQLQRHLTRAGNQASHCFPPYVGLSVPGSLGIAIQITLPKLSHALITIPMV